MAIAYTTDSKDITYIGSGWAATVTVQAVRHSKTQARFMVSIAAESTEACTFAIKWWGKYHTELSQRTFTADCAAGSTVEVTDPYRTVYVTTAEGAEEIHVSLTRTVQETYFVATEQQQILRFQPAMEEIHFNSNGGTSAIGAVSDFIGAQTRLPATGPTHASESVTARLQFSPVMAGATLSDTDLIITGTRKWTFDHWSTASDDSGIRYEAGGTVIVPEDGLVLYAIYKPGGYPLVTLPTGTLTDYELVGFSKSLDDIILVPDPYEAEQSVTLYAIWRPEGTTGGWLYYVSHTAPTGITEGMKIYVEGMADKENDGWYTVKSITYADSHVSLFFEEDFKKSGRQDAETNNIRLYGEGNVVPELDYICALNNRLWGCSSSHRTVYASALGDPTDFWTFAGDSLDAWQVAVGTPGEFTGAVSMNNNVLFMKQHVIHKVLGGYPAEYMLYTYDIDGTSETNGKSLVNANGTVFFVTEHGIGTYEGSSSGILSKDLGEGNMYNSIGMWNGEQYYLHFDDGNRNQHTYVLDSRYGVWLEQDYGDVMELMHFEDGDYVLIREGTAEDYTTKLLRIDSGQPLLAADTDSDWQMTFKPFLESVSGNWGSSSHLFEKKRYSGLTFRLELPKNSWIKAELKSDDGRWVPVARKAGRKDGVDDFPVKTPRVDKIQLRLTGHGPVTILGMEREYIIGSRR